jgi:hypothetical protein
MQPWQFTAKVSVTSENVLPTLLWPETLTRTDSEIRVLRRASRTVIVLGGVPRSATVLPREGCPETSTAEGLSEPTPGRPAAKRLLPVSRHSACQIFDGTDSQGAPLPPF